MLRQSYLIHTELVLLALRNGEGTLRPQQLLDTVLPGGVLGLSSPPRAEPGSPQREEPGR